MLSDSALTDSSRLTGVFLALGVLVLMFGVIALTGESAVESAFGIDIGPIGANLVVLGAIVAAGGLWIAWPGIGRRAGIALSAALLASGVVLLALSGYVEPLLTRFVAIVFVVSGIRGAARLVGDLLPAWRHEGAIPLGEKTAAVSLLANGGILGYLLFRSRIVASGAIAGPDGGLSLLTMTVAAIVGVLVLESLVLKVLRGRDAEQALEDERDREIRAAAGRVAYLLLVIGIVFVAVQFGIGGVSERAALANEALGLSLPVPAAHLMLALLFLSQCGRCVAEIWRYEQARF